MRVAALVGIPAALLCLACAGEPADLVLVNGRVFTATVVQPWAEAVAIAGDRIAAVGTSAEIRSRAGGSTELIDLEGMLVVPGFNDAHAHPADHLDAVRLEGPPAAQHDPSFAEVLQRLRAAVARGGGPEWITGEIGAAVLGDPAATRFALDANAPARPVMLVSWTGHGTLFNTAALRRLGVRGDEPDPPGGFFGRIPGSQTLSGVAHEYAEYELRRRAFVDRPGAQLAAIARFARQAAGFGITSVQAMMTGMPAALAAKTLADADLPVRLRLIDFPLGDMAAWAPIDAPPSPSDRMTISGTKWILDGTPIERLMLLRAPYDDAPTRGRANFSEAALRQFLARAHAAGEQPILHAAGNAAIDMYFDALDATGGDAWRPLRPRVEHGDLMQPDQFEPARRLGVVVVQNPSHFMLPELMQARLGAERVSRSAAVRSLIAAGVPLAIGSDGPLSPFLNLMFAVTHAVNPREALTVEQAVVAYTRGSARAEFQEREKGAIAPGMLADLAVLSQDIFSVPADTLPETTSVLTILGGRIVHRNH